jgi:hypothetical protein
LEDNVKKTSYPSTIVQTLLVPCQWVEGGEEVKMKLRKTTKSQSITE